MRKQVKKQFLVLGSVFPEMLTFQCWPISAGFLFFFSMLTSNHPSPFLSSSPSSLRFPQLPAAALCFSLWMLAFQASGIMGEEMRTQAHTEDSSLNYLFVSFTGKERRWEARGNQRRKVNKEGKNKVNSGQIQKEKQKWGKCEQRGSILIFHTLNNCSQCSSVLSLTWIWIYYILS